jgi:hypothetical protein
MKPSDLPATVPDRKRLAAMLSGVETQFQSGEAYEAAKAAGFDVSERTLRNDLNEAAEAGILKRLGSGKWKLQMDSEIRRRIALALLSAGNWEPEMMGDGTATFFGPEPEELESEVDRYEETVRKL